MALISSQTLKADGATTGIAWNNPNRGVVPIGIISVYGTFGSGTATFQASPDGGTTFIDVLDDSGAVVAFTVNGEKNFIIPSSGNNPILGEQRLLRINLTGSTSPSLTIRISDSN